MSGAEEPKPAPRGRHQRIILVVCLVGSFVVAPPAVLGRSSEEQTLHVVVVVLHQVAEPGTLAEVAEGLVREGEGGEAGKGGEARFVGGGGEGEEGGKEGKDLTGCCRCGGGGGRHLNYRL